MVRLKAKVCYYNQPGFDISIPYGAIKSYYIAYTCVIFYIFQFLMVRLKVTLSSSLQLFSSFQFLMVRLKVKITLQKLNFR